MLLLAVWLILQGATTLLPLGFPQPRTVLAMLANASGVLLWLGR